MKGLRYIIALTALSSGSMLFGQSVVEALKYSQQDIRGTARYMGMAGAFGALGGDITTLGQNPAGIGVYRNSDLAATLDLSNQVSSTQSAAGKVSDSKFSIACNNFGFVWAIRLNKSALKNLNFGFAYNKQKSFDRSYKAFYQDIVKGNSLSNYIAQETNKNGFTVEQLGNTEYDPYDDMPWLNVLGYEGFLINPVQGEANEWSGVVGAGTFGTGSLSVREKGSVDEYNFNMGGNVHNVFYWGIGLTVTDFSYDLYSRYGEEFVDGYDENSELLDGSYELDNYLHTNGTAIKANVGVIMRVTNNLRLGLAFHTPNYYNMTDSYSAHVNSSFAKSAETPYGTYSYEFQSPWRLIASAAYVFGRKGILSFDYEYTAGDNMSFDDKYSVNEFFQSNTDIANIVAPMHTFKVGTEYMITNQFSGRLGYAYQTSPVKSAYRSGGGVPTVGTTTIYALDRATNYFTVGLGYRFTNLYLDLAYVHRYRASELFPFTPNPSLAVSPQVETLTDHNNSFALTLGVKF